MSSTDKVLLIYDCHLRFLAKNVSHFLYKGEKKNNSRK